VIRSLAINLTAASTASNNEDRTYRAEWRWTYRLLPMLTATQRNLLSADYVFYNYSPSNNRLLLDYSLVTALNAVLTPRLTLDLTHNSRVQPSGSYVTQPTGSEAFGKADENKNYTLGVRVSYTPTPGLALTLEPSYLSIARSGNVNGVVVPQRTSGTLNFSGGASVNVAVGQRGQLTGDIHRIFRDDRSTTYTGGVPVLSPLAETDYWSGGLTLTWAP
jgi:antitoxin component of MazEF toxin-antitoxin module